MVDLRVLNFPLLFFISASHLDKNMLFGWNQDGCGSAGQETTGP